MTESKKILDWTPEEDAELSRLWLDLVPLKRIADRLPGRTYSAIAQRRRKLKLPLRSGRAADPMAHPVMQKVWRTLKKHRATRAQLAERAGVAHSTVSKFVKLFASQIHICGWAKSGPNGDLAELLKAGPGMDVPRPPPASASERSSRWWEKCKRERPLDAGRRIARDSVRRREREGALVRRDIAAVALFGKADTAARKATHDG